MDAVAIVKQLRDLAKVPHNRSAIVRDQGCLPGLVLFLGNPDKAVVNVAVETIRLLAECVEIRSAMWNELGLVISLNTLIDAPATAEDTRAACREIIARITPAPVPPPSRTVLPTPAPSMTPRKTYTEATRSASRGMAPGFFRANVNTDARTITLQITGLNDLHARKVLENALLSVRGIISFTVDMGKSRAIVRARNGVMVHRLTQAVAGTSILEAAQVVRDDMGQERTLSFGKAPAGVAASPDGKAVGYLDDDDEDDGGAAPEEGADKAVAPWGAAAAVAGNWLSGAATYVSKTLYW